MPPLLARSRPETALVVGPSDDSAAPPDPDGGSDRAARLILLGVITGAHGIRGEVVIRSFTDAPESIAAYGPLSDAAGTRAFEITGQQIAGKGVIARIAGIADRTAAEALRGVELFVPRSRLPAPAEGQYYHADLVGLQAVDPAGRPIGVVGAVQNFGAGDLLEIRLAGRTTTELVPFNDAHVPEVDLARRRIVVVLPIAGEDETIGDAPA